jgi:hypothetical protein
MDWRRHLAIVGCLLGIAVGCGLAGGVVGHRLARQEMRSRADPETWHERATRRFEEVVRPTPEQSVRLGAHLDAALTELKAVRREAIARTTVVVDRLVGQVEAELTPEQKASFERIKPRRDEMNLEVLRLEPSDRK